MTLENTNTNISTNICTNLIYTTVLNIKYLGCVVHIQFGLPLFNKKYTYLEKVVDPVWFLEIKWYSQGY